jgi:hypothetical protein
MDKIRVNLILGEKQLATLKQIAAKKDTSVSKIIRTLVEEYLKKEKA